MKRKAPEGSMTVRFREHIVTTCLKEFSPTYFSTGLCEETVRDRTSNFFMQAGLFPATLPDCIAWLGGAA